MDFGGFDSSIIIILRGGISRPTGNFPERLTKAMLVGIILVGRLGVGCGPRTCRPGSGRTRSPDGGARGYSHNNNDDNSNNKLTVLVVIIVIILVIITVAIIVISMNMTIITCLPT